MDLQTRKIEFIQKFLNLTDENAVIRLENQLKDEVNLLQFDLKKRVLESEKDYENGNTVSNTDLISKYNG